MTQVLPLVSSPPSCSLLTFPACHFPLKWAREAFISCFSRVSGSCPGPHHLYPESRKWPQCGFFPFCSACQLSGEYCFTRKLLTALPCLRFFCAPTLSQGPRRQGLQHLQTGTNLPPSCPPPPPDTLLSPSAPPGPLPKPTHQALVRVLWVPTLYGGTCRSEPALPSRGSYPLRRDCWLTSVRQMVRGSQSLCAWEGLTRLSTNRTLLLASLPLPFQPLPPYLLPPSRMPFLLYTLFPLLLSSASSSPSLPVLLLFGGGGRGSPWQRTPRTPLQDRRCAWTSQCGKALQHDLGRVSWFLRASNPHK